MEHNGTNTIDTKEVASIQHNLQLEPASPEDAESVLNIMQDVCGWLTSKGILQWPSDRLTLKGSVEAIGRGSVYIAKQKGDIVGTLRIQWNDEPVWGKQPDDACYVHALAVKRVFAGQKIGLALLQWAQEQAAAAGKSLVRLDCIATNGDLRKYYQQAGFTFVREVDLGSWTAALFEKQVGSLAVKNSETE